MTMPKKAKPQKNPRTTRDHSGDPFDDGMDNNSSDRDELNVEPSLNSPLFRGLAAASHSKLMEPFKMGKTPKSHKNKVPHKNINKRLKSMGNDIHISDDDFIMKSGEVISEGIIEIEEIVRPFPGELESDYIVFYYFTGDSNFTDDDRMEKLDVTVDNDSIHYGYSKNCVKISRQAQFIKESRLFYQINDENTYIETIKRLIFRKICKKTKEGEIYNTYCGWHQYEEYSFTYIGVTEDSPCYEINKSLRFSNENMENISYDLETSAQKINNLVESDPSIALLLAYDCFAITGGIADAVLPPEYRDAGYRGSVLPKLNITGTNRTLTRNAIANIFCNCFETDSKRLNIIRVGLNKSLDKTSNDPGGFDALYYGAIPTLCYSRYGIKRKHNSQVKGIIKSRNIPFPVFISEEALEFDEIVPFDIGSIQNLPSDADELYEIREHMDVILYEFIKYLRVTDCQCYLKNAMEEVIRAIKKAAALERMDDTSVTHYFILLTSLFILTGFLSRKARTGQAINDKGSKYLITMAQTAEIPENNPFSLQQKFADYIRAVFSGERKVTYKFWQANEQRDEREECYYLDYSNYLKDFCEYCGRNFSNAEINKMLDHLGWVKLRSNKAARYLDRKHNGKTFHALVIIKSEIDGEVNGHNAQ